MIKELEDNYNTAAHALAFHILADAQHYAGQPMGECSLRALAFYRAAKDAYYAEIERRIAVKKEAA